MSKTIRALVLGDIFGQPGCRAVFIGLKPLIKEHKSDLVIVNGENAADGHGITPEIVSQVFAGGADIITSGNHIWQKREIYPVLESDSKLLRPANYPPRVPGRGHDIVEVKGSRIGVINLQGRKNLGDLDCPFRTGLEIAKKLSSTTDAIVVDFHAESVEEKEALAVYLDGKVSAVVGTHTHIQTADERILPKGTGFISDIGMTGPSGSVIGSDYDVSVRRSLTQMPLKLEVADNPAVMAGVILELDVENGRCLSIERFKKESAL